MPLIKIQIIVHLYMSLFTNTPIACVYMFNNRPLMTEIYYHRHLVMSDILLLRDWRFESVCYMPPKKHIYSLVMLEIDECFIVTDSC